MRTNYFGTLLKKYRLLSGINTLTELADLLADKSLVCENSVLSRWQNGQRNPSRKIVLQLSEVFVERQAINTYNQVNEFLESAGEGYLTDQEIKKFACYFPPVETYQNRFTAGPSLQVSSIAVWESLKNSLWFGGEWHSFERAAHSLFYDSEFTSSLSLHDQLSLGLDLCQGLYWNGRFKECRKLIDTLFAKFFITSTGAALLLNDRLGKIAIAEGDYRSAHNLFSRNKFQADKTESINKGNVDRHLAETYMLKEDWDNALKSVEDATKSYGEIDNQKSRTIQLSLATSHNGVIALANKKFARAKVFFETSLTMDEEIGATSGTGIATHLGLGLVCDHNNESKKAVLHYQEARRQIEKLNLGDSMKKAHIFSLVFKESLKKSSYFQQVMNHHRSF